MFRLGLVRPSSAKSTYSSLSSPLVTVHVAALDGELQLRSLRDVGDRDLQIGAAHPRIGVVGIEPRTAVEALQLDEAAEPVDTADTLHGVVESQLTVLVAAVDQTVAELVEDIAHQHREVLVLPLDVLGREVELMSAGLLADLVTLQGGQVGIRLQAGRETAVGIVRLQIVVGTEVVLGALPASPSPLSST